MTKTHKLPKNIFFAFFATIMLAISCLLASCGGPSEPPATMYSVTWDVSEKATVAVEGYEALPTQVAEDTDLVFTVTTAEGYEVSRVTRDSKKVTAKDGKYTVSITKDTKIGVETGKVITGIEVTKNPTKLTYFAGDALDVTGMEVKVNYATGDSEVITKGADGNLVSPSIFEGGETSFKVMYDDFEAVVNLDGRVEYLVTIDPAGGTIASKWVDDLAALELANYKVSETGVISFTYYNNLPKAIKLPVESQMSRVDFAFKGWTNSADITNQSGTYSTTAQWQAELVVIHSVELVNEGGVPYLVVEGQYKVANEVYLYLYEGNDNVSFTGDTYTNTSGENGAAFEVKFNLIKLAEATTEDGGTYEGKWMDIRFNAKLGERVESMELFVGEGSEIQVDMSQKVFAGGYVFLFQQYADMLKVYYNNTQYSYRSYFESDAVVFEGFAQSYKGATMALSAWNGSAHIDLGSTVIDATTGTFKLSVPFTNITMDSTCFVHIVITGADGTILLGEAETNFLIALCENQNEMVKLPKKVGDITHAIKHTTDDGVAIYAGYQWDGLILYRRDEARSISYDKVSIEYKNDTVYYVVSGESKGYSLSDLVFEMDLQHNSDIDGTGWDYVFDTNDSDIAFDVELAPNGTYKCYVPVSTIMAGLWSDDVANWTFTVHFGLTGTRKDLKPAAISPDYAVKDGVKYSLRMDGDTWSIAALVMEPTDEADGFVGMPVYTYQTATIANVNDKAVVTISGTYANVDAATVMASYYLDAQRNPYAITGSWDGDWSYEYPEATITAENGVWTLTFDITDFTDAAYTCHGAVGATFDNEKGPDLKLAEALDTSVTIGSRTYRMVSVPGSSDGAEFWGCLGFFVSTAA